jgi:hypothetical protein
LAGCRTTVERNRVAVVATLSSFDLFITTGRRRTLARTALAFVAKFNATLRVATVAVGSVSVVAPFIGIGDAVAAEEHPHAGSACISATIAIFYEVTLRGATVTGGGIAVVAGLTGSKDAVTTNNLRNARCAFVGARMKGFNLTDPGTTVTR